MKTIDKKNYYSITDLARTLGVRPDLMWQKLYETKDQPWPLPDVVIGYRKFYDTKTFNSLVNVFQTT